MFLLEFLFYILIYIVNILSSSYFCFHYHFFPFDNAGTQNPLPHGELSRSQGQGLDQDQDLGLGLGLGLGQGLCLGQDLDPDPGRGRGKGPDPKAVAGWFLYTPSNIQV